MLVVTVFSYFTVMWVAETGIRYEQQISQNARNENSPLIGQKEIQSKARYEVIDLVEFYLGRFQKYLYQAALMALMYIGLLAYSQVFCGAIGAVFWTNHEGSWIGVPQLVFGLMVIPLSCMELEEQGKQLPSALQSNDND
jgi:hypothetical protein